MFLNDSENSQENTCIRVFFLINLQARLETDSNTGVFLWILQKKNLRTIF